MKREIELIVLVYKSVPYLHHIINEMKKTAVPG